MVKTAQLGRRPLTQKLEPFVMNCCLTLSGKGSGRILQFSVSHLWALLFLALKCCLSCDSKNRLFPSSKKSHFQSEVKCEAIDMKMIFNCHGNKTHFHNKGFALSLVLKVRFFGTRK